MMKREITKREEYNPGEARDAQCHSSPPADPMPSPSHQRRLDMQPTALLLLLPSVTLPMWLPLTRKASVVIWELLF